MFLRTVFGTAAMLIATVSWAPDSDADRSVKYEDLYWADYVALNKAPHHVSLDDRVRTFENGQYIAIGSEHREPWPIELPLAWHADPFSDSDWRYQLNGWRLLEPNLQKYEETGEARYLQATFPYIRDWYEFNVAKNSVNPYKWYDAAAALRAMKIAYIMMVRERDHLAFSGETDQLLRKLANAHIANLTDVSNIVPNNHAFLQLHGAMALCRIAQESDGCNDGTGKVAELFEKSILDQFGTEGMHMEHSPGYHFFAFEKANEFMKTGWYGDIPMLDELVHKIKANAAWLVDPNGKVLEVGDSDPTLRDIGMPKLPSAEETCINAEAYRPTCYGSKLFRQAGFAVARSLPPMPAAQSSLLFMSGAFHSKSHRHADDLAIIWMHNGRWILSDTGRYSYGDGARRLYTRSTRAHSTVEVDDKSYTWNPEFAYGSALDKANKTDWGFDLSGKVWHHDLDAFHARRVLFRPNEWMVVVDRMRDKYDSDRKWTSWFNFEAGIPLVRQGAGLIAKLGGDEVLQLHQAATFPRCSRKMVEGQSSPRLQGWRAKDFRELYARPAWGYTCIGNQGLMVHAFSLSSASSLSEIKIEPAEPGFMIRVSGSEKWSLVVRSVVSVSVLSE